jgi:energy-coupling factor transporter ATP-binding protein EcfA2
MILILLRIRAGIPVIMMGETGCGKTSLITMLSRLLNNGSDENMKILNIHAGISDNDIVEFIEDKIINDAKKMEKEDNQKVIERKKMGQIYIPRKLWVFLDEINTCKSMGLISELMCKHSYQGNILPSNVVFIAACNPYRCYEKGKKINVGLDINQAKKEKKHLNEKELAKLKIKSKSELVYTVNPLPHSLLNYVFDFGNLESNDEKKYIKNIVEEPIKRIGKKDLNEQEQEIVKIHELATELISKAQNFIRDNNEISSVSLREIRRFNIFYEFFYGYLKSKKEMDLNSPENNKMDDSDNEFYKKLTELELHIYSII